MRLGPGDGLDRGVLPDLEGEVCKVEGISLLGADEHGATVLGVVDADDPTAPSWAVRLRLTW